MSIVVSTIDYTVYGTVQSTHSRAAAASGGREAEAAKGKGREGEGREGGANNLAL
eukprot:COSAG02_NODE_520_length_20751_cov_17.817112_10_plen_55_part_00